MKGKTVSVCMLLVLVLAGCGQTVKDIVSATYPLKDTVQSSIDANDVARIYVAKNQSIDDVVQQLTKKKKPNRISDKQDGKQVLVYDDYFVTLMKSKANPDNTEIEVASYTFVRDNYRPSFFEGLLALYLLDELFDVDDWGKRQSSRCRHAFNPCYGGYVHSGGHYKGPQTVPSFRGSMSGFFRGGGPNAGK
ncbi:MAG TPA: DUF4247 domain-containing protein [Bacillales bacterium]|nr:DUF4247 domain-containing protein [Bacillales bacterium]